MHLGGDSQGYQRGAKMRILRRAGREVTIALVDDLDGSEAGETVKFELDGMCYEIDLSKPNAKVLRGVFGPYIELAAGADPELPDGPFTLSAG